MEKITWRIIFIKKNKIKRKRSKKRQLLTFSHYGREINCWLFSVPRWIRVLVYRLQKPNYSDIENETTSNTTDASTGKNNRIESNFGTTAHFYARISYPPHSREKKLQWNLLCSAGRRVPNKVNSHCLTRAR